MPEVWPTLVSVLPRVVRRSKKTGNEEPQNPALTLPHRHNYHLVHVHPDVHTSSRGCWAETAAPRASRPRTLAWRAERGGERAEDAVAEVVVAARWRRRAARQAARPGARCAQPQRHHERAAGLVVGLRIRAAEEAPRSRPSTSYSSSGVGAAGRRYQGKCTVSTVLSSSCFTLIRVKTTVN